MGYRPRLRPEVRLEEGEDAARLEDPVTGHEVTIDAPWQRAILERMDGETDAEALVAGVADLAPSPRSAPLLFIKSLRYLRLTDDAEPEALARLAAARKDPEAYAARAGWQVLPGGRFGCQSNGACCRTYALGPLRDEDVRVLEAIEGIGERFPELKGRPPTRAVDRPGGRVEHYLPQKEGTTRCVFLLEDNLCGIHKHFGPEKKPAMCHLFPTQVILTLFGKQAFDRAECHSYGTSAFTGETYAERVRRHLPRLETAPGARTLFHPQVSLEGFLEVDFAHFVRFESHLVQVIFHPHGTIEDALRAIREATYHLLVALTTADDARQTPEDLFGWVASIPPAERYAGRADPPDRAAGLRALAEHLETHRGDVEGLVLARLEKPRQDRLRDAVEDLCIAAALCRAEAEGRGAPAGDEPWQALARRAASVRLDIASASVDRRLRRLLGDLLFSKEYTQAGTWLNAVASLAGLIACVLVGARASAARDGRDEATDADLDRAQAGAITIQRAPALREAPARLAIGRAVLDDLSLPMQGGAPR